MKRFWDSSRPIAIAHRGGGAVGYGKRNTMAAFRAAHKLGYIYLETDVVETKDGRVVVSHGAKTRLGAYLQNTFTYGTLTNLTYAEIKQRLKIDGQPIPLLEDVLNAFPDAKFFIDPKTDGAVEPLVRVISELKAHGRVLVNSFKEPRLEKIQQLSDNTIRLGLILGRDLSLLKKLYRLRRKRLKHLESVSVNHWLLSRGLVRRVHRQNVKILTWTVNSRRSINKAIICGVDGIISDDVRLLQELIADTSIRIEKSKI